MTRSNVYLTCTCRPLQELNENAATLFKNQDENDVAEGVAIMNECVIPCMHLMVRDSISQEDLDVIELIRNCWCSYLGQDMDGTFLNHILYNDHS